MSSPFVDPSIFFVSYHYRYGINFPCPTLNMYLSYTVFLGALVEPHDSSPSIFAVLRYS